MKHLLLSDFNCISIFVLFGCCCYDGSFFSPLWLVLETKGCSLIRPLIKLEDPSIPTDVQADTEKHKLNENARNLIPLEVHRFLITESKDVEMDGMLKNSNLI